MSDLNISNRINNITLPRINNTMDRIENIRNYIIPRINNQRDYIVPSNEPLPVQPSNEPLPVVPRNEPLPVQPSNEPLPIQPSNEALAKRMECPICLSNEAHIALTPCGHLVCNICSPLIATCPICRQNITDRLNIYYNKYMKYKIKFLALRENLF
jgi:hypothetical protein